MATFVHYLLTYLNTKWLWVQFIMKQYLKWGSILLIWTNNMAKIQSVLWDGWSYEWWGAWAKQSSENGWATKINICETSGSEVNGPINGCLKVSVSESRHIVVNHSLTHSLTWAMKHASQAKPSQSCRL